MRKSITKRIRITKRGKIVRRPLGTDHFRTRKSTKTNRTHRKTRGLGHSVQTILH